MVQIEDNEKCPKILVHINDNEPAIEALIDTGSDISLIDYDVCMKKGIEMKNPLIKCMTTASGDTAQALGSALIKIDFNQRSEPFQSSFNFLVHVLKNCPFE